jgi:hypothetical protein
VNVTINGGDPAPWHPLGLPGDEGAGIPGIPCDRAARPCLYAERDLTALEARISSPEGDSE